MVPGMRDFIYKLKLEKLRLFSWEQRKIRENLMEKCKLMIALFKTKKRCLD